MTQLVRLGRKARIGALLIVVLLLGVAVERVAQPLAWIGGKSPTNAAEKVKPTKNEPKAEHHDEGVIAMSAEKIAATKIDVAEVTKGVLTRNLTVPGIVAADPDRIARVAARVIGTVSELHKRLGDRVEKDEVVAILESREIAEARSEYIAAAVSLKLEETLFDRSRILFQRQIVAEQSHLRLQTSVEQARLRAKLARQKLTALHFDEDFAELDKQESPNLRRYELHAPIAGRIIERGVNIGSPVGGEGQAKELYTIVDLSKVWIELAISMADLDTIKAGQNVSLAAGETRGTGKIIFISPVLDKDSRSARVIAEVDNKDSIWRIGIFLTAQIVTEELTVDVLVPRSALQTIGGEQVVFVRNNKGFEKREVVLGKSNADFVEIVFGLEPGEKIAISNSFVLKAELGKAEAEHVH